MTSAIHELPDLQVRLVGPDDKEGIRRGFGCLSKKSILFRFNSPLKGLSSGQLRYLTEMDNRRHLAVCAHIDTGGEDFGVAIARYVMVGAEDEAAEFAVTVIDAYQNKGIGTHLLEELMARARRNGVRTFRGHVRSDNYPMLRILDRHPHRRRREGSLYRADIDLF